MIGAIVVGQDKGVRSMEKTEKTIEEIEKLAEIALEHEKCKTFRNSIITVALESIIFKCKVALDGNREGTA